MSPREDLQPVRQQDHRPPPVSAYVIGDPYPTSGPLESSMDMPVESNEKQAIMPQTGNSCCEYICIRLRKTSSIVVYQQRRQNDFPKENAYYAL